MNLKELIKTVLETDLSDYLNYMDNIVLTLLIFTIISYIIIFLIFKIIINKMDKEFDNWKKGCFND